MLLLLKRENKSATFISKKQNKVKVDQNRTLVIVTSDDKLISELISTTKRKQLNKIAKKWIDVECKICGCQAIGYNYQVITCASCKTFFRRNLHRHLNEMKCQSGQDQCLISNKISSKICSKCRLTKCFLLGMKKEKIDSKIIEKNLFSQLSIENWIEIENLQSSFQFYCPNPIKDHCQNFNEPINFINWSYSANDNALSFINYFQHIQQFQQLNSNDRFILIKYNLFSIFLSSKGYYYRRQIDSHSNEFWQREEFKSRQLFDNSNQSSICYDRFGQLTKELIELTERDSRIISILSIILIFSPGISMNENEPSLNDPIYVLKIQNYFIEILFNYLIDKSNFIQAQQNFIRLFFLILKIQFATRDLRKFFQINFQQTNTIDQVAPLMQTILNLS